MSKSARQDSEPNEAETRDELRRIAEAIARDPSQALGDLRRLLETPQLPDSLRGEAVALERRTVAEIAHLEGSDSNESEAEAEHELRRIAEAIARDPSQALANLQRLLERSRLPDPLGIEAEALKRRAFAEIACRGCRKALEEARNPHAGRNVREKQAEVAGEHLDRLRGWAPDHPDLVLLESEVEDVGVELRIEEIKVRLGEIQDLLRKGPDTPRARGLLIEAHGLVNELETYTNALQFVNSFRRSAIRLRLQWPPKAPNPLLRKLTKHRDRIHAFAAEHGPLHDTERHRIDQFNGELEQVITGDEVREEQLKDLQERAADLLSELQSNFENDCLEARAAARKEIDLWTRRAEFLGEQSAEDLRNRMGKYLDVLTVQSEFEGGPRRFARPEGFVQLMRLWQQWKVATRDRLSRELSDAVAQQEVLPATARELAAQIDHVFELEGPGSVADLQARIEALNRRISEASISARLEESLEQAAEWLDRPLPDVLETVRAIVRREREDAAASLESGTPKERRERLDKLNASLLTITQGFGEWARRAIPKAVAFVDSLPRSVIAEEEVREQRDALLGLRDAEDLKQAPAIIKRVHAVVHRARERAAERILKDALQRADRWLVGTLPLELEPLRAEIRPAAARARECMNRRRIYEMLEAEREFVADIERLEVAHRRWLEDAEEWLVLATARITEVDQTYAVQLHTSPPSAVGVARSRLESLDPRDDPGSFEEARPELSEALAFTEHECQTLVGSRTRQNRTVLRRLPGLADMLRSTGDLSSELEDALLSAQESLRGELALTAEAIAEGRRAFRRLSGRYKRKRQSLREQLSRVLDGEAHWRDGERGLLPPDVARHLREEFTLNPGRSLVELHAEVSERESYLKRLSGISSQWDEELQQRRVAQKQAADLLHDPYLEEPAALESQLPGTLEHTIRRSMESRRRLSSALEARDADSLAEAKRNGRALTESIAEAGAARDANREEHFKAAEHLRSRAVVVTGRLQSISERRDSLPPPAEWPEVLSAPPGEKPESIRRWIVIVMQSEDWIGKWEKSEAAHRDTLIHDCTRELSRRVRTRFRIPRVDPLKIEEFTAARSRLQHALEQLDTNAELLVRLGRCREARKKLGRDLAPHILATLAVAGVLSVTFIRLWPRRVFIARPPDCGIESVEPVKEVFLQRCARGLDYRCLLSPGPYRVSYLCQGGRKVDELIVSSWNPASITHSPPDDLGHLRRMEGILRPLVE